MNKMTIEQAVDYVLSGDGKVDFNLGNLEKTLDFLSNFPHANNSRIITNDITYELNKGIFEVLDYTEKTVHTMYVYDNNGKFKIVYHQHEFEEKYLLDKELVQSNKEYYQVIKEIEELPEINPNYHYIDDFREWNRVDNLNRDIRHERDLLLQKII